MSRKLAKGAACNLGTYGLRMVRCWKEQAMPMAGDEKAITQTFTSYV
jgi:hypothetical protein